MGAPFCRGPRPGYLAPSASGASAGAPAAPEPAAAARAGMGTPGAACVGAPACVALHVGTPWVDLAGWGEQPPLHLAQQGVLGAAAAGAPPGSVVAAGAVLACMAVTPALPQTGCLQPLLPLHLPSPSRCCLSGGLWACWVTVSPPPFSTWPPCA